jgi:hypothetical protein
MFQRESQKETGFGRRSSLILDQIDKYYVTIAPLSHTQGTKSF